VTHKRSASRNTGFQQSGKKSNFTR
jgi:RES domain